MASQTAWSRLLPRWRKSALLGSLAPGQQAVERELLRERWGGPAGWIPATEDLAVLDEVQRLLTPLLDPGRHGIARIADMERVRAACNRLAEHPAEVLQTVEAHVRAKLSFLPGERLAMERAAEAGSETPPETTEPQAAPALPIEPETAVRRDRRAGERLIRDVERRAAHEPGRERDALLEELREQIALDAPDQLPEFAAAVDRGERARALVEPFYGLGFRHGAESDEVRAALQALEDGGDGRLVRRATTQAERGASAAARRREAIAARREGRPLTVVARSDAQPEHRIHRVAPAPRWTVVVDETGSNWETDSSRSGVVAVAIPHRDGRACLPLLPARWHAVKERNTQIDRVLQAILDAPVGILGLRRDHVGSHAPGTGWSTTVLETLALLLRLLPLDGETFIDVEVEEREPHERGENWRIAVTEMMRQLGATDPVRALSLKVKARVIGKSDSRLLAYADAVAHTWAAASDASRQRLAASGLRGTCLYGADASAVRQAVDLVNQGMEVSSTLWRRLVADRSASDPSSVVGTLVDRLAAATRTSPARWQQYLDAVNRHLESKAVDLAALVREVSWLEGARPASLTLPARVRLGWYSAILSQANHLGDVAASDQQEMAALAATLRDEDLRLVCEFDLRRAVAATNGYDFETQRRLVEPWLDEPVRALGLQLAGRVRSSMGQHHAFTGALAAAATRLDEALDLFQRLSDPQVRAGELAHTGAYRAIVAMDDPDTPTDVARTLLVRVIGPLDQATRRLAASALPSDKYAHHLLVRWLVLWGSDEERSSYLAGRQSWGDGAGFPWPVIHAWRAALLEGEDPDGALDHLLSGRELARGGPQGPTLRLIGAALGALAEARGWRWEGRQEELDDLGVRLPQAAAALARIRAGAGGAPIPAFLADVLPFNFR